MFTQAEIATQLKISEPTLRKHFRDELDGGAFKANMKVGGNMYALTQSADEQVRLRACQWWTSRRMGWKETSVNAEALSTRERWASVGTYSAGILRFQSLNQGTRARYTKNGR